MTLGTCTEMRSVARVNHASLVWSLSNQMWQIYNARGMHDIFYTPLLPLEPERKL